MQPKYASSIWCNFTLLFLCAQWKSWNKYAGEQFEGLGKENFKKGQCLLTLFVESNVLVLKKVVRMWKV